MGKQLKLDRMTLVFKGTKGMIDYNYYYPLMKVIYECMTLNNDEYAFKIHNEGYKQDSKTFKLFNYHLYFENVDYKEKGIQVNEESIIKLIISGEVNILNNIIKGIIKQNRITLNNTNLKLMKFENSKCKFNKIMLYKVRSPLVESIWNKGILYLNPTQERFYNALGNNLLRKYKIVYGKEYEGNLYFDIENILKIKQKYITNIKKGFIIGYSDFEIFIEADEDMQRVAYYLGLGQNNSIGMGNISYITGRAS